MSQIKNESWFTPFEYKVLIEPETIESKTIGGLYLPEITKEREQMAQVRGILVAIGANAFEDWKMKPEIGDNVYFGKYAGAIIKRDDGKEFRVCNDKDLVGRFEKKKEERP